MLKLCNMMLHNFLLLKYNRGNEILLRLYRKNTRGENVAMKIGKTN